MGTSVMMSERREWRRLRALGLTYKAIATLAGRRETTVARHVSDVRKPGVLTPAERLNIRRLRKQSKTFKEIAAITGRAEYTCWYYAHDIKKPRSTKEVLKRRAGAQRIEALFASCNRAVAEGRA